MKKTLYLSVQFIHYLLLANSTIRFYHPSALFDIIKKQCGNNTLQVKLTPVLTVHVIIMGLYG